MDLFPDQQEAIETAEKAQLFILTGSAGTGKSTVIRALLTRLSKPGMRVALAAPSGKAAKRLAEVTGRETSTIHRLLEPQKTADGFAFTRGPSHPIDADLIVLDEVSMIDISLMARFLEAVAPGTKLILVGDPYQLPSVGPGNVLRDIQQSKAFPAAELNIVKRQGEGLLLSNCHRIRNGQDILDQEAPDFQFIALRDENGIQDRIVELVAKTLPQSRGLDPMRDIQVLSPFREKTLLSCKALNHRLQAALNSAPAVDGCRFKPGDRVIAQKNDYELGIFNGDMGRVAEINRTERKIEVRFEDPERLVKMDLFENDLSLGYCLTIHKSQGSEWPAVIIPIHRAFGSLMMTKNLAYTATSRAKKLCILVGHREEIRKIVRRPGQERRFTGLTKLLNGEES